MFILQSNNSLIGVIVGGYDEEQRVRSAKETAKRKVDGKLCNILHLYFVANTTALNNINRQMEDITVHLTLLKLYKITIYNSNHL